MPMFAHLRRLLEQLIHQSPARQEVDEKRLFLLPDPLKSRTASAVLWRRDTIRIVEYHTKVEPGIYQDMDAQLYVLLKRDYSQMKDELDAILPSAMPNNHRLAKQLGIAIAAVGLLTYGELEVVEDIFRIVPPPPRHSLRVPPYAFILGSLAALLPLPKSIDVYEDPEAAVSWLRRYRSRIYWNQTNNAYILLPQEANS